MVQECAHFLETRGAFRPAMMENARDISLPSMEDGGCFRPLFGRHSAELTSLPDGVSSAMKDGRSWRGTQIHNVLQNYSVHSASYLQLAASLRPLHLRNAFLILLHKLPHGQIKHDIFTATRYSSTRNLSVDAFRNLTLTCPGIAVATK